MCAPAGALLGCISHGEALQSSTVTVPRDLMGRRAVRMLLRRITGDQSPPRVEQLPYTIEVRDTTTRRR